MNAMSTDVATITETWLNDRYDSGPINIPGFSLHWRDRQRGRGGGMCTYVSQTIPGKRRSDLESPQHEYMLIWLRPYRLPRPLSGIITGVVYNPPDKSAQEQNDLIQYLVNIVDLIRNSCPDCGVAILGDFNNLDTSDLISHQALKQIVQNPTRGQSILDLILTNFSHFYDRPVSNAPLGSSNHNIISWNPLSVAHNQRSPTGSHAPKKCSLRVASLGLR